MSKSNGKNYFKKKAGGAIKDAVVTLLIGMALDGLKYLVDKNKKA